MINYVLCQFFLCRCNIRYSIIRMSCRCIEFNIIPCIIDSKRDSTGIFNLSSPRSSKSFRLSISFRLNLTDIYLLFAFVIVPRLYLFRGMFNLTKLFDNRLIARLISELRLLPVRTLCLFCVCLFVGAILTYIEKFLVSL